ncbi:MAG: acyltransferase family protein [Bacteroidales bacterium]|nr:acyltransferase family protein [Bacteroidales bacterium]
MRQRLYYLDNLKVMLTLLVIFHHAGQAYGQGGGWAYTPSNPDDFMPYIWHFFSTNAAFFMGLYFFISGYFVPASFDHQGFKTFVSKKLLRLGLPFVLMGGLLSAAVGKFELAHMWFVENLLFFCLLYALYRCLFKPISKPCTSRPTLLGLTIVALIMGVGSHFTRQHCPQDYWTGLWILVFEPAHYLQYVMMFVLGLLAYRFEWLSRMSRATGLTSLILGTLLAVGNYLRLDGVWSQFVWQWFGIYESLMCIFISFGLLWLYREYANGQSVLLRWCAEQSYGAYIFHLPLMLIVQNILDEVWVGAFGKFMLVGIVTTLLAFLQTWLLRLVPGVKKVL